LEREDARVRRRKEVPCQIARQRRKASKAWCQWGRGMERKVVVV
jgi:hypothetical protein